MMQLLISGNDVPKKVHQMEIKKISASCLFTTHIQVNESTSGEMLQYDARTGVRTPDVCNRPMMTYSFTCTECADQGYDDKASGINLFPKRCRSCNIQHCAWNRGRVWKKKFLKVFVWRRHRFPKLLTFGIPGTKQVQDLEYYRSQLRTCFNRLRKTEFWTEHVDGGMWFFEITSDLTEHQGSLDGSSHADGEITGTINPHMHCIILGPKKIPMPLLNQELDRAMKSLLAQQDAEHVYADIQAPPQTSKSDAVGYLLSYLKKANQCEGRNRASFGIMRGIKLK